MMVMMGILFACACSHPLAPVGHYQDTAVIADGNMNDWTLPLRFSNPEYSMQYSVTNDRKNIYICVFTKDDHTQMRMLKAGMTVYFDPKGEKNKEKYLVFPVKKPSSQPDYRNGDPIRNTDEKMEKNQLLLESDYYNVSGFSNVENGQFGIADKKSNIQVAIKINNDSSLVYEAIVPVKDLFGTDLTQGLSSKNFSVGIVIGNIATHQANRNGGNSRPSYGGGMRGMHMGGMGGGQRNYSSGNTTTPKEEENWYQFRLAYKNA
jgi:hypothetical protein